MMTRHLNFSFEGWDIWEKGVPARNIPKPFEIEIKTSLTNLAYKIDQNEIKSQIKPVGFF
jgi:hypothetical protein